MLEEDTQSFRCEPKAIGTSITIKLPGGFKTLEICEVQILGKGNVMYVMIYIATNIK
jgi:hypothetical protein